MDTIPTDLVRLADVAKRLGTRTAKLRTMAERGEFPELLRVTSRTFMVRESDVADWLAGRWTRAEVAKREAHWQGLRAALPKGSRRAL